MIKIVISVLFVMIIGLSIYSYLTGEDLPLGSKITGKITSIIDGTPGDGGCFVKMGDISIIVMRGGFAPYSRPEAKGKLDRNLKRTESGVCINNEAVGRQVEVFARDLGENNYTLYGSSLFYMKLVK